MSAVGCDNPEVFYTRRRLGVTQRLILQLQASLGRVFNWHARRRLGPTLTPVKMPQNHLGGWGFPPTGVAGLTCSQEAGSNPDRAEDT